MQNLSELQRFIILGNSRGVVACLRAGVDPNYRAVDGKTSLFMALYPDIGFTSWAFGLTEAFQGTQTFIPLLLASGADPHLQDGSGQTPMAFAYKIGNFVGIRLLEAHCDLCKYSSLEQKRLWDEHRKMLRDLVEELKNPVTEQPFTKELDTNFQTAITENLDYRFIESCE